MLKHIKILNRISMLKHSIKTKETYKNCKILPFFINFNAAKERWQLKFFCLNKPKQFCVMKVRLELSSRQTNIFKRQRNKQYTVCSHNWFQCSIQAVFEKSDFNNVINFQNISILLLFDTVFKSFELTHNDRFQNIYTVDLN